MSRIRGNWGGHISTKPGGGPYREHLSYLERWKSGSFVEPAINWVARLERACADGQRKR
jgi:hypothetical protein